MQFPVAGQEQKDGNAQCPKGSYERLEMPITVSISPEFICKP